MTDVEVQNEPEVKTDNNPAGKAPAFSGEVAFNQNITLYPGIRLPQYDKGAVKAYGAHGTDSVADKLFVLICEDHLTPRTMKVGNYAAINNSSLVRLVGSGPVDWPPAGRQKYCFIYENMAGMPLKKDDMQGGLGLKHELVLNNIIRPVVSALLDLRDKDIVHGCIRLSNIYDGGKAVVEKAVLGECLSVPASSHMPVLYEPIDRALANPTGRGVGTAADDLYSFGVCLALMLRTNDPLEGMTDDEIIEAKMEEGTYVALTGKDRFTGAILELLRGLLFDDENQRWTLDEVVEWLDGRRLSPKQTVRRIKASRPLPFNGEKYFRPEILAKDLNKNTAEAKLLIENGELFQWLSRAMENKIAVDRYEKAVEMSEEGGKGAGYSERLIARVSMALHPEGPIRYKTINVMPDGVGTALTEAFVMKRDLQTYIDFFMNYFITQWVDIQFRTVPDVSNLVSKFDGARAYLRQKSLGGGLERCIYSLNSEAQCLSEKIQKFQVHSPEELMQAYEKLSAQPGRPTMFFDRQIIAFLAVKDRKNIDPYLPDLNAEEVYRRVLAELKVLATIQKRSQLERFPGIAGWVLENLAPVYERFHDRELRTEIRRKVDRLKDNGDLAKIVVLFDNPTVYQEDNVGFRRAMRKFYDLEGEYAGLEKRLRDVTTFGLDTGRQVACITAAVLAVIIIIAAVFMGLGGSHAKIF